MNARRSDHARPGGRPGAGAPRDLGLRRRRKDEAPCGLCGVETQLTRTHVPPRCAGNDHGVSRSGLLSIDVEGTPTVKPDGKRQPGGLYIFGLCARCNGVASRYDSAYGEFADALKGYRTSGKLLIPNGRLTLPTVEFSPGAVARSILIGLFGMNHLLRNACRPLADALRDELPSIRLPEDLHLRLALCGGTSAILSGAMVSQVVLPPTTTGTVRTLNSAAAVYFPPLAWQLTWSDAGPLDDQGWADASGWAELAPAHRASIRATCRTLPIATPLWRDPDLFNRMWHLFSGELTPIVQCEGLTPWDS